MTKADEVILREYVEGDLDGIVRLDETCFDEEFRFDRRSMRAYAEARNAISLIAEREDEIVGFVIAHLDGVVAGLRGYIVTLDVAAEYRRRGLAGRMMQAVEMLAKAGEAQRMELHVFTENEGAIRFYERRGYERIARRWRFYGAEGLDAFEYRKELVVL
jgi:[ribosomal protein S18]-alanine N-acetyltransferase